MELGEAIHIKHGFAFRSQYFSDNGQLVVLTPGNFNEGGGFRVRPDKDRFYSGAVPKEYVLRKGDLIIAMTEQGPGLLGSSALVPHDSRYLHNQRLGLVDEIDVNALDKQFLYYLFNTRPVRAQLSGSATGTKVRHTAPERIYRVKVAVPADVKVQRRIASALRVYDDLIENSRRRIRLLEQAARLVYEEWFVRLRFPGCEHVAITDGTPKGWRRRTIGEVCPFRYGNALKKEDRRSGVYPVFGSSGIVGTHDEGMTTGPGIVIGRKGNIGSVFWSGSDFWPIDTVYYIDSRYCTIYIYYALLYTRFINTDVAVPGLNRNFAHSRELLIPDDGTYALFEQHILALHGQIDQLAQQNRALAHARDLLLPRLLCGEIAV